MFCYTQVSAAVVETYPLNLDYKFEVLVQWQGRKGCIRTDSNLAERAV